MVLQGVAGTRRCLHRACCPWRLRSACCSTIPVPPQQEVPCQTQTRNLGTSLTLTCATVSLDHLQEMHLELAHRGLTLDLQHLGHDAQQGTEGEAKERDLRRRKQAYSACGRPAAASSSSVWPPWHSASFIDFPSLLTGLWPASFLRLALTIFLLAVFFLPHVDGENGPHWTCSLWKFPVWLLFFTH